LEQQGSSLVDTTALSETSVIPPSNDLFRWIAVYEDGSTFEEYLGDEPAPGRVNSLGEVVPRFQDIDQARLRNFILIPNYDNLRQVVVNLFPEDHLVFFRRTDRFLNLADEEDLGRLYAFVVGARRDDERDPVLTFIFMDGSVAVGRDRA
jgi:hypothetical protein